MTCFRHVLGNHGHTGVTDTEIKRTIGKTLEESFSILTGITEAGTLADYKREYVKAADVHMTANTFFFPETIEVLEALKSQGAVLGIVSTKFRYRILDLFEKTGYDGLVDFIVGGEDVKAAKPDPRRVAVGHRTYFRWREIRGTVCWGQCGGCRNGTGRRYGFFRCIAWHDHT